MKVVSTQSQQSAGLRKFICAERKVADSYTLCTQIRKANRLDLNNESEQKNTTVLTGQKNKNMSK